MLSDNIVLLISTAFDVLCSFLLGGKEGHGCVRICLYHCVGKHNNDSKFIKHTQSSLIIYGVCT